MALSFRLGYGRILIDRSTKRFDLDHAGPMPAAAMRQMPASDAIASGAGRKAGEGGPV
jgi:hypothetical protein